MPGRPRRAGEHRVLRSGRALRRGGCVVGVGGAAGAFLALGMTSLTTAPPAHADIEDLIFQPIVDAIGQAASLLEPSTYDAALDAATSAAPAAATDLAAGTEITLPAATTGLAAGTDITVPAAATGLAAGTDIAVPLESYNTTEAVTDLSVNGGPQVPALVDTGSDGLVIPSQDLGSQTLNNLLPVGAGIGAYSGGLDYFYLTYDLPVNFDGVVSTTSSPVDVELFSWPTSFQSYFQPDGVDAVLGVGPNAVGPGPSDFTSSLPGGGEGVFIDENTGTLEFGSNPDTGDISVGGAPDATLGVTVTVPGETTEDGVVSGIIDSGGVYGTIPSSLAPFVPVGDPLPVGSEVSVYNIDDQLLYSYDVTNTADSPTVVSGDTMDTGYYPFEDGPVYIDNTVSGGSTVFDYTP